jgi:hypothetical protein
MELPDDILKQVREFSRPITRPDWRRLRKMTSYHFHKAILYQYNRLKLRRRYYRKVIYNFVANYCCNPQDKYIYVSESIMDYERFVSVMQLRLKN